jgi:hypothetical protein
MKIQCDDPDLYASSGPVSSLPGSSHPLPDGAKCDLHPDRNAVARIQGETDSMGCEYNLMCEQCLTEYRAEIQAERTKPSYCDWCKTMKIGCRTRRDYEEGMSGPVYNVCKECDAADQKRWDDYNDEWD